MDGYYMIKRITLDTNSDVYGEADNLYVKIHNDIDNTFELQYPAFTEIYIEGTPTGIYVADIEIDVGKYTISIINDILSKEGIVRATITEETSYDDLGASVSDLSNIIDGIDESSSFA